MFATIIPFLHSIGTEPLLYACGDIDMDQLSVGQIVEIPYGNNRENGIIVALYETSPIDINSETFNRIKTIIQIISSKTILDSNQLMMIREISSRYMIPIHRVLAIFLTRPILSRLEKKNYEQLEEIRNKEQTGGKKGNIHILQDDIVRPKYIKKYLNGEPTIIILPDDFSIIPYQEYFSDAEDILFVTNDMTDTRRAQAWIDITNGVFPIIYGTRKLLYYNLSKYRNIIYIEDALGPDYWHYPIRINYSDILRIFEKSYPDIELTIITSVPTLSTLTYFRNFEIKNIQSNTLD